MSFKCALCGKEYKSKGWLMRHLKKEHGDAIKKTKLPHDEVMTSSLGEEYDPRWLTECPKCGHVIPKSVAGCWYCKYILDDNIRDKVPEKKPKVERKKRRRKNNE